MELAKFTSVVKYNKGTRFTLLWTNNVKSLCKLNKCTR